MQQKDQKCSFFKGCSFSFEDDSLHIDVWFSFLSGMEKVHVNDKLVFSQRNISTHSNSAFTVDNKEYSTKLETVSLFSGPVTCTLSKDGRDIKKQKLSFSRVKKKKRPYYIKIIFLVILWIAFGITKAAFNLPGWTMFAFLGCTLVASIIYDTKLGAVGGIKLIVENEEIDN